MKTHMMFLSFTCLIRLAVTQELFTVCLLLPNICSVHEILLIDGVSLYPVSTSCLNAPCMHSLITANYIIEIY